MIISLFSKNIKICSEFDLKKTFLVHFLSESKSFDEVVYIKKYKGVSKFDDKRKVVYVNENDSLYRILIYALRSFYALECKSYLLLHSSAVSIDSKQAILFVGPPSSGKTTILKNALKMGYYYISEDLLFIRDNKCFLSPPFKFLDISKLTKSASIKAIYFINFRYGAKFIKFEADLELRKRLLFESLMNTKALSYQFETFKKLLRIEAHYVMYSNCLDLLNNL